MKVIILSAGQGKRLLPATKSTPKCLLAVDGNRPALEVQLSALVKCGLERVTVMVGFRAERVEQFLAESAPAQLEVTTRFNPFFEVSNNLATCWTAIPEMTGDFLLLNGDTLFDHAVLERLLASPVAPVTLAINRKDTYDRDDMKVSLKGGRTLAAVGKDLPASVVHGESIGMMAFRGLGVGAFRKALDRTIREPNALGRWYLSVINVMTQTVPVETVSIEGLWWAETDTPEDLTEVRKYFSSQKTRSLLAKPQSTIPNVE